MTPPKPLTAEETAAVEAAIAAGKLQRIPLGVYAECDINLPLREIIRRAVVAGQSRILAHNSKVAQVAAARRNLALRLEREGLTPLEIAGRLGTSRNTVYSLLSRARAEA